MSKMPTLFVGHGSPLNAITENQTTSVWKYVGAKLPQPKAILAISAHWNTHGRFIHAASHLRQIYDMYGFPAELYAFKYEALGSEELARHVAEILGDVQLDYSWGLDHGLWSVLCHLYPQSQIPIVPFSVDMGMGLKEHLLLAKALAPLRDEGVLLLASGNIVHNLALLDFTQEKDGYEWAKKFDESVLEAISLRDEARLIELAQGELSATPYALREYNSADFIFSHMAYNVNIAHKLRCFSTLEHFIPLLYAFGASSEDEHITFFNRHYCYGSLSMSSFLCSDEEFNF